MKPLPLPDADTAPYWQAASEHRLICPRCTACGMYAFPPAPRCGTCSTGTMEWTDLSGHGKVFSHCVMHVPLVAGFEPPYVVADIELAEQPGLRITTNILHCPIGDVRIGMPVIVTFEDREPGLALPQFEPAQPA
jgi:uncharacterized OB-fold protein